MEVNLPSNIRAVSDELFSKGYTKAPYLPVQESLPPGDSLLARGVLSVLDGDIEGGGRQMAKLIGASNTGRSALINVLYLVSQGQLKNQLDFIYHKIAALPADLQQIKANLTVLLAMGECTPDRVEDEYVLPYIKPAVKHFRKKSLVYFHVPKCAGTSVNQLLGQYFYGDAHNALTPGYIHSHLAACCIANLSASFPYLSTKHLGVTEFPITNRQIEGFTLFRDPVKRLHSMFTQSVESASSGYNLTILPKYNHHWRYWDAASLEGWLGHIPESLLNGQIFTFSRNGDNAEAKENVSHLAFTSVYSSRDDELALLDWLNHQGVFVDKMPKGLNASHRPPLDDAQKEILKHFSAKESRFLSEVMTNIRNVDDNC